MNQIHTTHRLEPPSAEFLLGTDNLGRDLLTRVIYGARVSMIVGLSVSTIATLISVTIGMLSGYIGGKFDLIVQRIVDAFMSLPMLILLLAIISVAGQGMFPLIIAMGIVQGIGGARHSRGFVLSIVGNQYLDAARAIGCRTSGVLVRHVLPNIAPLLIVGFTVLLPGVILTESALSFLGYGVPPPAPSWGAMLSGTNRSYMFLAPWMVIWPGLALSVVVWGTHMLGDALRDLLDPRLKGGTGRYGSARHAAAVVSRSDGVDIGGEKEVPEAADG
jgi:peptide/nickel transport system permease protein